MDDRHLEYFVAVAETLGFASAAMRVSAAQSTVSVGIRVLETELGVELFERSSRRVALTAEGEELLPLARQALQAIESVRATARREPDIRGRLRLGVFTNLRAVDLPGILGDFRRRHPAVELVLSPSASGSSGFVDDVRRGVIDVAFLGLALRAPGLERHLIASSPFVALLPAGHPLADRREVSLDALAASPFVDAVEGFGNRVTLDAALLWRGLTRQIAVEVADLGEIPRFVAAGLGVGALPALTVVDAPGTVTVPLRERVLWRLEVVTRRDPTPAARALVAAIETATAGLRAPEDASA